MLAFFRPLLSFILHLGYFAPFVMGVFDSSFLFLPFGNDLVIIALVSRHHAGMPFYILFACCGSTLGVFILALVARKLGEEGIRKVAGSNRFEKMKKAVSKARRPGYRPRLACSASLPLHHGHRFGGSFGLSASAPPWIQFPRPRNQVYDTGLSCDSIWARSAAD